LKAAIGLGTLGIKFLESLTLFRILAGFLIAPGLAIMAG
jgi:hypothetical protein